MAKKMFYEGIDVRVNENNCILTDKLYNKFMKFLKKDMKDFGHEEDFKLLKSELDKNESPHTLKMYGEFLGRTLTHVEVGIDNYPQIINGGGEHLLRLPKAILELIIEGIVPIE